jgi:hypothetical protein
MNLSIDGWGNRPFSILRDALEFGELSDLDVGLVPQEPTIHISLPPHRDTRGRSKERHS